ncbi:hypothetical protein ACFP47_11430 [Nesterenkonia lacusekhoensis]|uniref:Uncharacterized protein n=1 Tax=Nesterenkonia lacusekhoensis TaxID=150832 RepID=A0ABS4T6E3_9MICC|nr:hypothetical protein [Nesterenkonia lacusekhoensis]MBP2319509.1 hypothetical protein [Nesterenkonia lacusekhoensis]
MATTKFNPKARAEEIARQLKEAEEAKQAYDAAIDKAVKDAGRTRAEFVEMLYEYFSIEPVKVERRDKETKEPLRDEEGNIVMVNTDRDESKRIEQLAEKFEEMVKVYEASRHPKPHAA